MKLENKPSNTELGQHKEYFNKMAPLSLVSQMHSHGNEEH